MNINNPLSRPIAVVLFVVLVITSIRNEKISAQEAPRAYTQDLTGVTLELVPLRPSFIEGEDVLICSTIRCDTPRSRPFPSVGIIHSVVLRHDSGVVRSVQYDSHSDEIDSARSVYRDTINISNDIFNVGQYGIDTSTFSHLRPGNYIGNCSIMGVLSPQFQFVVTEVPYEYRMLWNLYERLRKERQHNLRLSDGQRSAMFNDARETVRVFGSQPPNSVWRYEALYNAAIVFQRFRSYWVYGDSIHCDSLLRSWNEESRMSPSMLVNAAALTLFANDTPVQLGSHLIPYARELGGEAYIPEAQEAIDRTRRRFEHISK